MHRIAISPKKVKLTKRRKEVLKLFKDAYQTVLDTTKAVTNETVDDHNMQQGEAIKKESSSLVIQKSVEFIHFVTGIDLSEEYANLPVKTELFEPVASDLFAEYMDYLERTLLPGRRQLVLESDANNAIDDIYLLIYELFLRFGSEILQYQNLNERDGDKLILGFSMFIDKLKKCKHFINPDNGMYTDKIIENFLKTIPDWMNLFGSCVKLIKTLNINNEAITAATSVLRQLRCSLMTVPIVKYLRLFLLNQNVVVKSLSGIFDSLKIDLQHVYAVEINHAAGTLRTCEEEAARILKNEEVNKKLIKQKSITLPDYKQQTVSGISSITLADSRKILIELMDNYIESHNADSEKNYPWLKLTEAYTLITKTNQFIKVFSTLSDMTKAGGWYMYISGAISLADFNEKLRVHHEECLRFIKKIDEDMDNIFKKDEVKAFKSALIHNDLWNAFKMTSQFGQAIGQLEMLSNPALLKVLANHFIAQREELKKLEALIDCKLMDESKFKILEKLVNTTSNSSRELRLQRRESRHGGMRRSASLEESGQKSYPVNTENSSPSIPINSNSRNTVDGKDTTGRIHEVKSMSPSIGRRNTFFGESASSEVMGLVSEKSEKDVKMQPTAGRSGSGSPPTNMEISGSETKVDPENFSEENSPVKQKKKHGAKHLSDTVRRARSGSIEKILPVLADVFRADSKPEAHPVIGYHSDSVAVPSQSSRKKLSRLSIRGKSRSTGDSYSHDDGSIMPSSSSVVSSAANSAVSSTANSEHEDSSPTGNTNESCSTEIRNTASRNSDSVTINIQPEIVRPLAVTIQNQSAESTLYKSKLLQFSTLALTHEVVDLIDAKIKEHAESNQNAFLAADIEKFSALHKSFVTECDNIDKMISKLKRDTDESRYDKIIHMQTLVMNIVQWAKIFFDNPNQINLLHLRQISASIEREDLKPKINKHESAFLDTFNNADNTLFKTDTNKNLTEIKLACQAIIEMPIFGNDIVEQERERMGQGS